MSSDLVTLQTIFSQRPTLHPKFLQAVLEAHGNLTLAVDYLSSLPDNAIPSSSTLIREESLTTTTTTISTPLHSENFQPTTIDLSDPESAQVLLNNLKEIVIPSLTNHLKDLTFPDLVGEAERLKYSLARLRLEKIHVPSEAITLQVEPNEEVVAYAKSLDLDVVVEEWAYRVRFPPLHDSGRAVISFTGIDITVRIAVQDDGKVIVKDCKCSIQGGFNFRANKAKLSWLYNVLVPIFRTPLTRSLESTVEQAVKVGIEEQLEDWSSWVGENI